MAGKFIVTRGKATELLETSEQVFDQMPSTIAVFVPCPWRVAIAPWRNDRLCTDALDIFNQSVRVVAFVRNYSAWIFYRIDQFDRLRNVRLFGS